ncbi:hypothetical protein B0H11DRAFT_1970375 [Mycena galericulata]|nr:hypothetical protein B0H11DRAFT_1970375 [Mycena galericulata]
MRFSAALALFSLFAASASASYTPLHRRQFPDCASNCLANPNLGGCASGDDTCLCNNNIFVTSTFQCIEAACKGEDLANAIAGAASLCAAVHVTLVSAAGAEFSATASIATVSATPTATSPAATTPAASAATGPAVSDAAIAPAASTTGSTSSNGAMTTSLNTAFLGLAAIGALALAL